MTRINIFLVLFLALLSTVHSTSSASCFVPKAYQSLHVGSIANSPFVAKASRSAPGTYNTKGDEVMVEYTTTKNTFILGGVFWFEIKSGERAGTRVGSWACCSSDAHPYTNIQSGCGGESGSTLVIEDRMNNDFALRWKYDGDDVDTAGTLVLKGSYVTETISQQLNTVLKKVKQINIEFTPYENTEENSSDKGPTEIPQVESAPYENTEENPSDKGPAETPQVESTPYENTEENSSDKEPTETPQVESTPYNNTEENSSDKELTETPQVESTPYNNTEENPPTEIPQVESTDGEFSGLQTDYIVVVAASPPPATWPPGRNGVCGPAGGFPASPTTLPLWYNNVSGVVTERLFVVPPTAVNRTLSTPVCDSNGQRCWKYYDITLKENLVQFFPTGQKTSFYSYGQGSLFTTPGPTIKTCAGQQVVVRHHNTIKNADGSNRRVSIHLHGSASFAPYDGWADDTTDTNQFKDYIYPTNRPATLWYHDHSFSITSDNALHGLYAQMWVENCCVNHIGVLPDAAYDYPLFIADVVFDKNNQIFYDKTGVHSQFYWADHNLINGVAWPVLHAEPRVYRFRVLVSAISRGFVYSFKSEKAGSSGAKIPFYVIGTDGGLLEKPVQTPDVRHGTAERYEIIVDLRNYKGDTVYMMNDENDVAQQIIGIPYFCQSHLLMKIVVDKPLSKIAEVTWTTASAFLNTKLLPGGKPALIDVVPQVYRNAAANFNNIPWGQADRLLEFVRTNNKWMINVDPPIDQIKNSVASPPLLGNPLEWETTFNLPQPHVALDPETNKMEVWDIKNGGGGWFHPVHIHLIDAIIVARQSGPLKNYEVGATKDVVLLTPSETIRVVTRWGPVSGSYMVHCHNLVHEDNDMLIAFGTQQDTPKIRKLSDNLYQYEKFLVIPTTPVNGTNHFATTLRNPMLGSERSKNEPPLQTPEQVIAKEIAAKIYAVFFPDKNAPGRNASAPIGGNIANPFEWDYTCLQKPAKPFPG